MRFYYIDCNNIMILINLWAETEIHICIYTCVYTQTISLKVINAFLLKVPHEPNFHKGSDISIF